MQAQDTHDTDRLSMPWVKPRPVPAAPATHVGAKANVLTEHPVKTAVKQLQSVGRGRIWPGKGLPQHAVPFPCRQDSSGDHRCHFVGAECQTLKQSCAH